MHFYMTMLYWLTKIGVARCDSFNSGQFKAQTERGVLYNTRSLLKGDV